MYGNVIFVNEFLWDTGSTHVRYLYRVENFLGFRVTSGNYAPTLVAIKVNRGMKLRITLGQVINYAT